VVEGTTDNPQSTYAYTKKVSEDILVQSLSPKNIALVNLRFFNVIGCDTFSNAHDNSEECLVPVIANHLVNQSRMKIFGTDHPTKDGTCLRDYIDVRDLARAHGLVAREMGKQKLQTVINVSTGIPVSVLDVIKEFERVAGKDLVFASYPADAADPVGIWSQQSRTLRALGWNPEFSLTDSIKSHWYSLTK
jgi:UDP-glucose 4-epimerase